MSRCPPAPGVEHRCPRSHRVLMCLPLTFGCDQPDPSETLLTTARSPQPWVERDSAPDVAPSGPAAQHTPAPLPRADTQTCGNQPLLAPRRACPPGIPEGRAPRVLRHL